MGEFVQWSVSNLDPIPNSSLLPSHQLSEARKASWDVELQQHQTADGTVAKFSLNCCKGKHKAAHTAHGLNNRRQSQKP